MVSKEPSHRVERYGLRDNLKEDTAALSFRPAHLVFRHLVHHLQRFFLSCDVCDGLLGLQALHTVERSGVVFLKDRQF